MFPIYTNLVEDGSATLMDFALAGRVHFRPPEERRFSRFLQTQDRLAGWNGPWRQGSVYLYVLDLTSNIILFHGANPDRFELRPLVATVRDAVTGELILPQVIEAAKSSPEGGFVEYFFDDPTDDNDSADIPKVGYAREFTGEFDTGQRVITLDFIVGSGFYGRAPEDVSGDNRTEVAVTVLGEAVEGLAVEFSRAVSGRRASSWSCAGRRHEHRTRRTIWWTSSRLPAPMRSSGVPATSKASPFPRGSISPA